MSFFTPQWRGWSGNYLFFPGIQSFWISFFWTFNLKMQIFLKKKKCSLIITIFHTWRCVMNFFPDSSLLWGIWIFIQMWLSVSVITLGHLHQAQASPGCGVMGHGGLLLQISLKKRKRATETRVFIPSHCRYFHRGKSRFQWAYKAQVWLHNAQALSHIEDF